MKRYDKTLRRYVEETAATDLELRRVAGRLDDEFGRRGSLRQSLVDLPVAKSGAEERLLVRLDRARAKPVGLAARLRIDAVDPRLNWKAPALAAMAALLLVGVFLLRDRPASELEPQLVESTTGRTDEPPAPGALRDEPSARAETVDAPGALRDEPSARAETVDAPGALRDEPSARAETPLALVANDLSSPAEWTESAPAAGVALRYRGAGALSGESLAPRIAWTRGTVEIEVEPHPGIDLQVRTPEGIVTVVGTAFDVTRDVSGTSVSVRRGKVHVACVEAEPVLLVAGQSTTCLPGTPAGFLVRARLLIAEGGSPVAALGLVERGLGDARGGPVGDELLYLRIELLMALGRPDEARTAADRYLAEPSRPRTDDLRDLFSPDR